MAMLALIGLISNFWIVVVLIMLWSLAGYAGVPIRQAYLNGMIPSQQRATILSFDSLIDSAGGIVAQPLLGKSRRRLGLPGVLSALGRRLRARPARSSPGRASSTTPADRETAPPAPPSRSPSSAEEVDA